MFALVVRFDLRPGGEEAFDRLVAETLDRVKAEEPGTVVYACHQVQDDAGARVFYEVYRDRAAFDAHEAKDYVRRFLAEREQYLTDLRVEFLSVVDAKGITRPEEA